MLRHARPGGPVHDLVQERAHGHRVVGHRRPGRPQRRRPGQRGGDRRPAVLVETAQSGAERGTGQAGGVGGDHLHRHVGLAGRGELGPVRGHPFLRVQPALLGEDGQHRRRHSLAARGHHHQGVRRHGSGVHDVGAAPQVDHRDAVDDDRHGRGILARIGEVGRESVGDPLEPGCDAASNGVRHPGRLRDLRRPWESLDPDQADAGAASDSTDGPRSAVDDFGVGRSSIGAGCLPAPAG